MSLYPIDQYPANEATGVPRNASLWVQFNKTLNTDSISYVNVSVGCPDDQYIPLEGTVTTVASSTGYPDTIIKFNADDGMDAWKRYGFFIQGGQDGVEAYDGDKMSNNLYIYFKTNNTTTTNDDIPATGVPAVSGIIPSGYLEVFSTYPENYETNMPTNLKYIKIQFNKPIPTGVNLYDKIKLTSKDVNIN